MNHNNNTIMKRDPATGILVPLQANLPGDLFSNVKESLAASTVCNRLLCYHGRHPTVCIFTYLRIEGDIAQEVDSETLALCYHPAVLAM